MGIVATHLHGQATIIVTIHGLCQFSWAYTYPFSDCLPKCMGIKQKLNYLIIKITCAMYCQGSNRITVCKFVNEDGNGQWIGSQI